jgi:hypothetical protein
MDMSFKTGKAQRVAWTRNLTPAARPSGGNMVERRMRGVAEARGKELKVEMEKRKEEPESKLDCRSAEPEGGLTWFALADR